MAARELGDSVESELATWMVHLPGVDPAVEGARQRIRRLARSFDRVLDLAASGHDLSVGDWEALSVLQRAGAPHELSPSRLASALGITSGTVSVRIERLTKAGLVEPSPDQRADGRSRPVRLTERGRDRWRAATEDRTRIEHRLLAGSLTSVELTQLNVLLAELLARFESDAQRLQTGHEV